MVKKKGKKKKSKKVKSDNDQPEDLNLIGDGAQLGISKEKKKKKAKLSKEEKEQAKIEKRLNEFLSDENKYYNFWNKMHGWMKHNEKIVQTTFRRLDSEEDGVVPFEIFKAGLRDLECPALELEVYALARILDQEKTGLIDYTNFKDGLQQNSHAEDSDDEEETDVNLTKDDYVPNMFVSKEPMAQKVLCDPSQIKYPRYIELNLKLKEFAKNHKHPGNITIVVLSHMTISGVLQTIRDYTEISSGQMNLFNDEHCTQEHWLAPYLSITDCGFQGGPENKPEKGTLYYDYTIEFDDCPLLNCDFYFGQYQKPMNPVLKSFPKYMNKLHTN